MRLQSFAAVLFDMDGTLVDTEPVWHQAEISIFTEHGIPWTVEDALQLTGLNLTSAAEFMQRQGVTLGTQQIVERLTELQGLGMTYAIAYFVEAAYDTTGIELFEREVIPALA